VDHNALQGSLGEAYRARVIGCIDHHNDEGKVPFSEDERNGEPRIIEPAGSCTSLVINHFQPVWDSMLEIAKSAQTCSSSSTEPSPSQNGDTAEPSQPEINIQLAKLALASILVDTSNLQNADKTTEHDRSAVAYLSTQLKADTDFDRKDWFRMLQTAKKDLDSLRVDDVLRKDYKEWNEGGRKLGISSVVKPLEWLSAKASTEVADSDGGSGGEKEAFAKALRKFVDSRQLAVYAIMTTSTSSESGEFMRELLLWGRETAAQGLAQKFKEQAGEKLGLEKWQEEKHGEIMQLSEAEEAGFQVWRQRKVENSRKQVAPLLREAMALL